MNSPQLSYWGGNWWWNGLETEPVVVLKDQLESFSVFGSEPVGKAQWFTKLQKAAKVLEGGGFRDGNFYGTRKSDVG